MQLEVEINGKAAQLDGTYALEKKDNIGQMCKKGFGKRLPHTPTSIFRQISPIMTPTITIRL